MIGFNLLLKIIYKSILLPKDNPTLETSAILVPRRYAIEEDNTP